MAKPTKRLARTLASPAVCLLICERIANGEPLLQILRDPGMPSKSTIYDAIDPKHSRYQGDELAGRFARAREEGYDAIAEGTLEIADNARNDWMAARAAEGEECEAYRLNGEHVQRSKLRIETRLKLLAKWSPKKYGDRLELGGAVGVAVTLTAGETKVL